MEKQAVLDLARRVLDDMRLIGVDVRVETLDLNGGVRRLAVVLKWDPTLHPETRHDPAQAIVLENINTGRALCDDTLKRALRERIEHMLRVDGHAMKELISLDTLSVREGRDVTMKRLGL